MWAKITSMKEFWRAYHSISSESHRVPSTITDRHTSVSTAAEQATLLNNQFVSTFSPRDGPIELPVSVHDVEAESLCSFRCDEEEVFLGITSMRLNVACGPDGMSSKMLKSTAPTIFPHLTRIFNLSLESEKVPSEWKTSSITPIFKAGDPSSVSNYRPISLLSLVSKLLERQVHNVIMSHVLKNGFLSDMQFGFRPCASTQEAILAATRDWHRALENGQSVACVFFDLSKAFDSLPHSLVLESLARVGIGGELLIWIRDYLSGRKQQVVLRGASSPPADVTSGVPQGSILGPLLFILSVDSLTRVSISLEGRLSLFADDICYYRPVISEDDLLAVQVDVDLIREWISKKKLRLNVGKTKAMLISRKRVVPVLSLKLDDHAIAQVSSFKFLGITIASDLSWGCHISNTCCKAKRFLGFLYRYFHLADSKCLARLYKSLVLPMLDYGCCVWAPHQAKYIAQLERVQSFAARIVTKQWKSDAAALKSRLGWTMLVDRRSYMKLCVCRRILFGESLIPADVFTQHPSTTVRHLNSKPLFQPYVRTVHHQNSFFHQCCSQLEWSARISGVARNTWSIQEEAETVPQCLVFML